MDSVSRFESVGSSPPAFPTELSDCSTGLSFLPLTPHASGLGVPSGKGLQALDPNHRQQLLKKQRVPPGKGEMIPSLAPSSVLMMEQNHETKTSETHPPTHPPSLVPQHVSIATNSAAPPPQNQHGQGTVIQAGSVFLHHIHLF